MDVANWHLALGRDKPIQMADWQYATWQLRREKLMEASATPLTQHIVKYCEQRISLFVTILDLSLALGSTPQETADAVAILTKEGRLHKMQSTLADEVEDIWFLVDQRLKPGDQVQWTHVGSSRRVVSMSLKRGELVSIDGEQATVKLKSGRHIQIALARLRTPEQPTQLGEFVEGYREANRRRV